MAAREARIAVKTDALCLKHMLVWGRRGFQVLPVALVVAYLAIKDGMVVWAIVWLAVWIARQTMAFHLSGRIQRDTQASPTRSLSVMTMSFASAGVVSAALMPAFFARSTDEVLLLVSFLISIQGGGAVLAASGVQRAWLFYAGPIVGTVAIGWLWHGGALG